MMRGGCGVVGPPRVGCGLVIRKRHLAWSPALRSAHGLVSCIIYPDTIDQRSCKPFAQPGAVQRGCTHLLQRSRAATVVIRPF
jgi:hypothetical protein